ncbi:hypothetical protein QW180_08915 [Vibrio sinaloensis]|nr:hypothetical protein [Vibrio sinaloensis]
MIWAAFSIGLLISVFHYSPSVLDEIKAGVSGERIDFWLFTTSSMLQLGLVHA